MLRTKNLPSILLRVGLVLVFLYAAVDSFLEPLVWQSYLPGFLTDLVPAKQLLVVFSVYEIILSVWLISSRAIFYAALLSALTLFGILITNLAALVITFRDIGLLFAALALAALHKPD